MTNKEIVLKKYPNAVSVNWFGGRDNSLTAVTIEDGGRELAYSYSAKTAWKQAASKILEDAAKKKKRLKNKKILTDMRGRKWSGDELAALGRAVRGF